MVLHWFSLVECMEWVPCWPWMNSAYVCSYCYVLFDWPYSKLLLVFNAVCRYMQFHVIRHVALRIHRNVNNGLALFFVGWMHEMGTVLALDKQSVRLQLLIDAWCVIDLTQNCFWCSMQCLMLPHASFGFSNIPQRQYRTLHWSSLVECMEPMSCWPWTKS